MEDVKGEGLRLPQENAHEQKGEALLVQKLTHSQDLHIPFISTPNPHKSQRLFKGKSVSESATTPLSAYDQEPTSGDHETQKRLWPKLWTYTTCRDFASLRE
jgi:hypothetical protein